MTLKKNILIGYGVASALMSVVIVWAVWNFISLGRTTDAILRENYRSIVAADNMNKALDMQMIGFVDIFKSNEISGEFQFNDNDALFIEWLGRAKDNITINGETELVSTIDADYRQYRVIIPIIINFVENEEQIPDSSLELYKSKAIHLYSKIRLNCLDLKRLNEETMYATSSKASLAAKRAVLSTVILALSVLIIVMIFSQALSERILKPIRRLMDASKRISSGDYNVKVPVEYGGELGNLAVEFNEMAFKLSNYHKMNIEQILSEKNKGEAIISSIADGLIVFDMELKVVSINPVARNILNLGFVDLSGLSCNEIFHYPNIINVVNETVKTGYQPDIPDDKRIFTLERNKTTHHFLYSVTLIRGRDSNPSGIVLLLKDITHLREIERLKNEFVMAASHELRTPLTSIGMSVDLLYENSRDLLPVKDKELLDAAHEEVSRMKALLNDLLDLSRLESGKIDINFEKVSVNVLFEHVTKVFIKQCEIKGIKLVYELEKELSEIKADANKITWVLSNLISNALRYAQKGGLISLTARQIGEFIHFSVQDNGPGIPEEFQTKIFQKFVQVTGDNTGGSGLGLAICKEIVRAHGGTIWVESKQGEGSNFIFTLPIK